MDKTTLVAPDLEGGRSIVEALEEKGIEIDVAGWLQDSETGVWKLFISSPKGGETGVKPIAQAILASLPRLAHPDLDLDNFAIASPHERIVRDLKQLVRTGDELQMIRLYDLHLGGREFRSARIYRARSGDAPEGWMEFDARVRDRNTGRVGTIRGALDGPGGRWYSVLFDLEAQDVRPLAADQPPREAGRFCVESDLDFLYAVRPSGRPEKPPLIARPA